MKIFSSIDDPSIASALLSGQVGIIPTDTVYGLVARAQDERAIKKMYSLKPRVRQPGTLIAANIEQLHDIGFAYDDLHVADRLWPDALSVIVDASQVASYLKTDLPDLPVRIPNNQSLLELLKHTGPLMTTSANHPAEPTATNYPSAQNYFGDKVDFYVDGGELGDRPPSTIIKIISGKIEIIRQGQVTIS